MKNLFKILIAILMISSSAYAQNSSHQLLEKSFTPSSRTTKLEISNKFGNITLAVWDKNTISVDVTLETQGYNEKDVKKILDRINLKVSDKPKLITILTDLKSHNFSSTRKKNYQINYKINMPDGYPIELNNEFGNIFLTDYSGHTTIDLEYGNLTAGNLQDVNLTLEFGKGEIESITNGVFDLEYVDAFSLRDANKLQLEAEFSQIKIDNISNINFDVEHGKLAIGKVLNYSGSSSFSSMTIDEVYKSFKLNAEYASGTIRLNHVSKEITSFQLSTEFSKSEITIEKGANLGFDTKHSFGKFNAKGNNIIYTRKEKDMTEEAYTGSIGNESNKIKTILKIDTSYGGCTIIAE